jgi:predicted ATPase
LVAELIASRTVGVASIVVELAPTQVGEVATAVAAVLRLRAERASPATIVERLRDVEAVVVVDNAEHVLEEVRMLARALLDRCGRLRLLVTSRTRLDLPDEHVHTLTPLATDGARSSAVELFTERLLQAGRTSMVNASDADLRAICTRLDGLPLALELAAGRAATLGVGALHERLGSGLDLLATVSNDDGRHASLERVISWSPSSPSSTASSTSTPPKRLAPPSSASRSR